MVISLLSFDYVAVGNKRQNLADYEIKDALTKWQDELVLDHVWNNGKKSVLRFSRETKLIPVKFMCETLCYKEVMEQIFVRFSD